MAKKELDGTDLDRVPEPEVEEAELARIAAIREWEKSQGEQAVIPDN